MNWLKTFLKRKALALTVGKGQKELLEFFMASKPDFDEWTTKRPEQKARFHFFYPTAIDFYYGDFKLFIAYFQRDRKDRLELVELKMTETNFDTIRCTSWAPFEEIIIDFLTSLEESKKIALFEKRKVLYEYESLCAKRATPESPAQPYLGAVPSPPVAPLKTTG